MSSASVLYDAPGPRARRPAALSGAIATVAGLILIGVVIKRLAGQGQFAGKLWGPILNPSDESFHLVWQLIGKGVLATLTAAVLAITFSLVIGGVVGVARMMLGRRSRMPIVGLIELLRGLPVVILKDTSLAAVLGLYTELLRQGNLIALNLHNPIQILSVVGVIFILINYSLSRLATWVDGRSTRKPRSRKIEAAPSDLG